MVSRAKSLLTALILGGCSQTLIGESSSQRDAGHIPTAEDAANVASADAAQEMTCAPPLAAPSNYFDSGAQHQFANMYAFFEPTMKIDAVKSFEQRVVIEKRAHKTFWASWFGAPSGYIGLQDDGVRFDNTVGSLVIFSLWNADEAKGESCGTFGGEGIGYSCRLAFNFLEGRSYRLRVRSLGALGGTGEWWSGTIVDESLDCAYDIGSIHVKSPANLTLPSNFSEYFGAAVGCDEVPLSVAHWQPPMLNGQPNTARFTTGSLGECIRGSWTDNGQAVTLRFGGP